MIFEYLMTLLNLTSLNTPMIFPEPYQNYPCQNPLVEDKKADCSKINNSGYTMPLFLNTVLRDNLPWAMYLGIDILRFQLNDIWFDVLNLCLISIYFYQFGNPLYNKANIKISFSKTREIEKKLRQFTAIQDEKIKLNKQGINDNEDAKHVHYIRDKHQEFLGSSFYLMKLKNKALIYNFTRKMRIFSYIGLQLVAIIFIFIIAALSRSIMSFGYMLICCYLFLNLKDFFYQDKLQQKNKQWLNPYVIKNILLTYSFVDIALQILYQIPVFDVYHNNDYSKEPENSVLSYPMYSRYLGFDKIYMINHSLQTLSDLILNTYPKKELAHLDVQNMYYFILKSMNLFFIFLLVQIYSSTGYKKFVRSDLRTYLVMAQKSKAYIMAYFYNNRKLEKMISVQQKKKKMLSGLEDLAQDVKKWKRAQDQVLQGFQNKVDEEATKVTENQEEAPVLKQKKTIKRVGIHPSVDRMEIAKKKEEKLRNQKKKIYEEIYEKFSIEKLKLLNETDPYYKKKEDAYKLIISKLPILAKLYLRLNQMYVNQVLFIETINEATRIQNEAKRGIQNTNCDLKSIIMKEINIFIEKQILREHVMLEKKTLKSTIKKSRKSIQLSKEDMPETVEFVKFSRIILSLIGIIPKALISKMATLAYLFMIISMITNAGFISILYPFMVFGYALMEEGRPKKHFWNIAAFYTTFIIFMKTIFQLDIWFLINRLRNPLADMELDQQSFPFTYKNLNSEWRIGLIRVEGIIEMFLYILPEFIILIAIWTQQFYEIMVGVHEQREVELENISEARDRFLEAFNEQAQQIIKVKEEKEESSAKNEKKYNEEINEQKSDKDGIDWKNMNMLIEQLKNVKKEIYSVKNQIPGENILIEEGLIRRRGIDDFKVLSTKNFGQRKQYQQMFSEQKTLIQYNSFINDQVKLKERVKTMKSKNLTVMDKIMKIVKKKSYFVSLFPLIKEQKPGRDLYAKTTFWQFIITFYMINQYSNIDARGTQILVNTNQYSYYMTIMVFLQVTMMILERYISRTNVRKHNRSKNVKEVLEKAKKLELSQNSNLLTKNKSNMTSMKSTLYSTTMKKSLGPQNNQDYNELSSYTELEPTYITVQQFLKWFIQIAQLIIYHYVIFWLYPIASNKAIYGSSECNINSFSYAQYKCFDFTKNISLIVFYLLFCEYFRQSALQIRYGFSDWREPSSLTRRPTSLAQNLNIVYVQLPFLLELKTVLDWCFTKTSLDIFQWLELAEINNQMFNAFVSNSSYYEKDKKLGKKVSGGEKRFCGCFCISLMLFFLVGPFAFFSNMSFVATYNPVNDLKLGFSLVVTEQDERTEAGYNRYEFNLYQTESPILMYQFDKDLFEKNNYTDLPDTKFFDPQQVQLLQMKNSSDSMWQASAKDKQLFKNLMKKAADPNSIGGLKIDATLDYQFMRNLPETAKVIKGNYSATITNSASFINMTNMDNCENKDTQYRLSIQHFMPRRLRAGQNDKVSLLRIQREKQKNFTDFLQKDGEDDQDQHVNFANSVLTYSCQNYWGFSDLDNPDSGITLQIFSDLISTGFWSEASIFAFYLGTAMTIGTLFRTIVMYKADRIFILDARDTSKIRNLIAAIYRQRHERNLKKEEEYYFLLLDILRNPQLFTHITGSSLKGKMDPNYEQNQLKIEAKKQKDALKMRQEEEEEEQQQE